MKENTDHDGRVLPKGAMYTAFLTQEMLDECSRALGRPLMSNEVQLLDRMLARQHNKAKRTSNDELTSNFMKLASLLPNAQ